MHENMQMRWCILVSEVGDAEAWEMRSLVEVSKGETGLPGAGRKKKVEL